MQKFFLALLMISLLFIVSCSGDSSSDHITDDSLEQGASTSFVPYLEEDFESCSLGRFPPEMFFDADGRTSCSEEQSYSGNQAAKMEIHAGDKGGFGLWGAVIPIAPAITRGGEVWVRLRVYWPTSFEFSASPWMKFIRLHNKSGSTGNAGYNDLYIDQADKTTSVLRCIKEIHDIWAIYNGPKIPRNQWETYEMYLFVDNTSVDNGGQSRMRIWRDTELIFDRTDVPTISDPNGVIDYLYLFTYWNNENPPDNYVYIDDLVIATGDSPPPQRDAYDHPFVGNY